VHDRLDDRAGADREIAGPVRAGVAFADRSVRYFWPISRSQVYSELSRLQELGWVSGTVVAQDRYPDKRVYEPTPDGLRALRHWLDVPAPLQRIQDVVLRTFFGEHMSSQRLSEQFAEYRQQAGPRPCSSST
jgi:DNA-binding PadR family transcriptional regulator